MNVGGAIVIFVIVWWTVLFAVLPFGVRSRWEDADDHVKGADPGAPVRPDLKRKMIWTTGIAAVVTLIIIGIILSGWINFRE